MKEQLEIIRREALSALEQAADSQALEALRVKYLGKKGELTAVLKQMASSPRKSAPSWARWPTPSGQTSKKSWRR